MNVSKTTLSLVNIFLSIMAVLIVALKVFYPYHRVVAITMYGLSWIPFVYSIAKLKSSGQNKTKKFGDVLKKHKTYVESLLVLLITAYLLYVLFPVDKTSFLTAENVFLEQKMNEDSLAIEIYKTGVSKALDNLKANQYFFQRDINSLSREEKETLLSYWSSYLDYTIELESIKEVHKYFYQINYLKYPKLHFESFMLAYTALLVNYENGLILDSLVGDNDYIKTILNERHDEMSIPKDSFFHIKQEITNPNNLVKLNAGQANIQFFKESNNDLVERQHARVLWSEKKFQEIYVLLGKKPVIFLENPLDFFEKNTFKSWFPFQKHIALGMGSVKTAARDYFISYEQIQEIKKELEPGDILVERKNWYLSNIGIPGFWPHAALYTGTLEELESYFSGVTYQELTITEHLQEHYPQIYSAYRENITVNVIEAIAKGVIVQPLEVSAHADYLGALRPRTSKEENLKAIITAFSYFGKPYDYNFDFATDNELVCSELVFKAYESNPNLHFAIDMTAGRFILPPTKIVEKFDQEYDTSDRELDFVLFFEGSEDQQKAMRKGLQDFRNSWKKPKWDIAQE